MTMRLNNLIETLDSILDPDDPYFSNSNVGPLELSENDSMYEVHAEQIASILKRLIANEENPREEDFGIYRALKQIYEGEKETNLDRKSIENPESHCAWYSPYLLTRWNGGIYLREDCILSIARNIKTEFISAGLPFDFQCWLKCVYLGFFTLYHHEYFHHKVESFGLRCLIAAKSDCYRDYNRDVYRRTLYTTDNLEEALANAYSFNSIITTRHQGMLSDTERAIYRKYLAWSFSMQSDGYNQAEKYFGPEAFKHGSALLQSQIIDVSLASITASEQWSIARDMLRGLFNFNTFDFWMLVPSGSRSVLTGTTPYHVARSKDVITALVSHYGYSLVKSGGKGSHQKLRSSRGYGQVHINTTNAVSAGVAKHVVHAINPKAALSDFPKVLNGTLRP